MTKVEKLKALFSFLRLPDDSFVSRLNAIHDAMAGNAAFPNPPVDLVAFKAAISTHAASIVVALDGSKQAKGNKLAATRPTTHIGSRRWQCSNRLPRHYARSEHIRAFYNSDIWNSP